MFVHAEPPLESSGSSTIRRRRLVHLDPTAAGTAQGSDVQSMSIGEFSLAMATRVRNSRKEGGNCMAFGLE